MEEDGPEGSRTTCKSAVLGGTVVLPRTGESASRARASAREQAGRAR